MLTLYSRQSSLKKKFTVMVIWLVALALTFLLVEIIKDEGTTLLTKVLPVIVGSFMIAGILLRCKFARAFTLITLYFLALFPLVINFLHKGSFLLFLANDEALFTIEEVLATNIIWAVLFIIPIYFFSNNKSMEIFYIESNPKEHVFFILVVIGLIVGYAQLFL